MANHAITHTFRGVLYIPTAWVSLCLFTTKAVEGLELRNRQKPDTPLFLCSKRNINLTSPILGVWRTYLYGMKERILQLDYLKGVFILLMVIFHLSLIEQTYPLLREAVYTFHMSAFLIISGYLANVEKDIRTFGHSMLRLIIPYFIFEAIYILMLFFLGKTMHTTNSIENLTILSFMDRIAEHPTGPYWYIHTLIICTIVYFIVYKVFKLKKITGLILTGFILYGLTLVIAGFSWANVIYFLIGIYLLRCGKSFMEMISPSLLAVLPLCILFSSSDNFNRGSLAGIAITILVISFLLYVYTYCPNRMKRFLFYLGKNSLAIVVFSPIFTVATKLAVPYFSFDQTAICFVTSALCFVVACCLFSAWLCDKIHISKLVFFKDNFYIEY